MGGYKLVHFMSGKVYAECLPLSKARTFCSQHLLKVAKTRAGVQSDMAAGLISVYDARYESNPGIFNPGF